MLSKREREHLAKKIIAEIAKTWDDTPDAFKLEQDGAFIFTFILRNSHGATSINYNPQEEAVEIIAECDDMLAKKLIRSERIRAISLHSSVESRIRRLLSTAPDHFRESLWQLSRIVSVAEAGAVSKPFIKSESQQKDLVNNLTQLFSQRLSARLISKVPRAPRKFSDFEAQTAILELGGRPSQNQLAKKLNTTPKTIRDWVRGRGFDSLDALLGAFHSQRGGV
jgi:hypothetical protein